jgi:3',5'-cyclic AMP phosphodiesterase CpdA
MEPLILYSGNMVNVKREKPGRSGVHPASVFTLAHLSDPHLSSPEGAHLSEFLNKRISGYLSWWLHRRHEHRGEVIEALERDLAATGPDHIVITGDLTHLGLPNEFQMVEKWLRSLGPPGRVTLVPGNHDAYIGTPWDETFGLWADFMSSDAGENPAGAHAPAENAFPILRIRRDVALIGLSTAHPSPLFFAIGGVGRGQMQKLEKILEETGRRGLMRIVLIHHPLTPGLVSWRKRLTDAAELRAVLARQGAELVLHGHGHRFALTHLDTPDGPVTALGVPSASALGRKQGRRARYHLCEVTRNAEKWDLSVSVRRYSISRDRFLKTDELQFVVNRKDGR